MKSMVLMMMIVLTGDVDQEDTEAEGEESAPAEDLFSEIHLGQLKKVFFLKGWLAIAKLKPLLLFISLLLMLKKTFYNVKIEK